MNAKGYINYDIELGEDRDQNGRLKDEEELPILSTYGLVSASYSSAGTTSISLNGLDPGEYFIDVFGHYIHDIDEGVNYTLEITAPILDIKEDKYEINNDFNEPYKLGSLEGRHKIDGLSIHDNEDVDYLNLEILYKGDENDYISLDYFPEIGELKFDLLDSNDLSLIYKSSTQTSTGSTLSLNDINPGDYTIKVSSKNESSTNNYSLNLDLPSSPDTKGSWTAMYYFVSNNLNNWDHDSINDLELALNNLPSDVNIAVMWDQPSNLKHSDEIYSTGGGSQPKWTSVGRAILKADDDRKIISSQFEILDELDTGEKNVIKDFINWANDKAPANNQSLTISGHSSGLYSITGDDGDDGTGSSLKINELSKALEELKVQEESIDIEVLKFDGCLTGTIEMAYPFRDLVDFTLGTQEVMSATSANMDTHLTILQDFPDKVSPEELSSSMIRDYQNYLSIEARSSSKDTLSSIDAK